MLPFRSPDNLRDWENHLRADAEPKFARPKSIRE